MFTDMAWGTPGVPDHEASWPAVACRTWDPSRVMSPDDSAASISSAGDSSCPPVSRTRRSASAHTTARVATSTMGW